MKKLGISFTWVVDTGCADDGHLGLKTWEALVDNNLMKEDIVKINRQ